MHSTAAAKAAGWGVSGAARPTGKCKAVAASILFGPTVILAICGYALWGIGGLAPAAVALLVAFLILRTSTTALVGALAPSPSQDARLDNIVRGLSDDLGTDPPATFIVRGRGKNALVFWHQGRPALGVTAEAVSGFARTELEAVIAHLLARLDPGSGRLDPTALRLGGTLGTCALGVTETDDVRAAAITRYPPALAKAIEKTDPAEGRFAYLWFVADHRSHVSSEARLAALSDL